MLKFFGDDVPEKLDIKVRSVSSFFKFLRRWLLNSVKVNCCDSVKNIHIVGNMSSFFVKGCKFLNSIYVEGDVVDKFLVMDCPNLEEINVSGTVPNSSLTISGCRNIKKFKVGLKNIEWTYDVEDRDYIKYTPNYKVKGKESFVGSGRYGNVFRVEDESNRVYALKIIKNLKKAYKEFNVIDKIYIAQGFRINPYIALPRIEGEKSLSLYLPDKEIRYRGGAISYDLAIGDARKFFISKSKQYKNFVGDLTKLLFDVLSGLSMLHGSGFVHRDIKLGNVLIFKKEDKFEYKISDFGTVESAGNFKPKRLCGTKRYFPPEYDGKKFFYKDFLAATKGDIYSLGFSVGEIMMKKDISYDPLSELILAMVAKNPENRPSAKQALKFDLFK